VEASDYCDEKTNGIWNQAFKNQVMKFHYYLRHDDSEMNKDYEKGIGLNT
jgi:hypothetical protein